VHQLIDALAGLPPQLVVAVLAIMPMAELRGSIPYGVFAAHRPLWEVTLISILFTWLAGPVTYLLIKYVLASLNHIAWVRRWWDWLSHRATKHTEHHVSRWGIWGLVFVMAIPVPFIGGIYTGAFASYLLGVPLRQFLWMSLLGTAIMGLLVAAAVASGSSAFEWMLKR
jgi:uncharacterized membrane protein